MPESEGLGQRIRDILSGQIAPLSVLATIVGGIILGTTVVPDDSQITFALIMVILLLIFNYLLKFSEANRHKQRVEDAQDEVSRLIGEVSRFEREAERHKGKVEELEEEVSTLETKIEQRNIISRQGVAVLDKTLIVDVGGQGRRDEATTNFTLTSTLEEKPVSEFATLVRTEGKLAWDELDVDVEGGSYESHDRYVENGRTTFVIQYTLDEQVTRPDTTHLSQTVRGDLITDPESDWARTAIREPTGCAQIDVILPENYVIDYCESFIQNGGEAQPDPDVDVITTESDDGRPKMTWRRSGLTENNDYLLRWDAHRAER